MISPGSHLIIYMEGILTERVTQEGVHAMVEGGHLDRNIVSTMGWTLFNEFIPCGSTRDDRLRRIWIPYELMQWSGFYLVRRALRETLVISEK